MRRGDRSDWLAALVLVAAVFALLWVALVNLGTGALPDLPLLPGR